MWYDDHGWCEERIVARKTEENIKSVGKRIRWFDWRKTRGVLPECSLERYCVTILVVGTRIIRLESSSCCLVTDKYFIQVVCSLRNDATSNLDHTASNDSTIVNNELEKCGRKISWPKVK